VNEQDLLDPPAVEEEVPSLRETIESAVEEHAPETPSTPAVPQAPAAEPKAPVSTQQTPEVPPKPAAPTAPEVLKAPSQWKPAVREQWNKIPRPVQEEILRREADNMRLIGAVGPKIRMADDVVQHLSPYAERLQANGVPPQQFVNDIFETVRGLSYGNHQEKAEIVANIIQAYGVDLNTLDAMLSSRIRMPPEVAQARYATAQARAVIQNNQQWNNQQQEHMMNLEAEKHVAAFGADPKHEFLDDVRDFMADLIESGKAENLEDAYASAVWANPDTRKILLQREAQARISGKTARAVAARRASSSISGSPAVQGAAMGGRNLSLRDTIEAAIDEHTPL